MRIISRFMAKFQPKYQAFENDRESDEFISHSVRDQIYERSDSTYRQAFITLLIVDIVAVLLWVSIIVENGKNKSSIAVPNAMLESIRHDVQVIFKPDERFQNFSLEQNSEDSWESLLPPGRGFIEIPGYESSKEGPIQITNSHYAISMFHQLHCLASLQSVFATLTSPSDSLSQNGHDHIHGLDHVPHCFDYIRQAIMCAGDTSFEEAFIVPGTESEGLPTRNVDGWGTAHLCRDWEAVWEFAKSHRYRNSSGIL